MISRKYATFALINGKIVSVDKNDTVYEAVAVTGNIITAVGTTEEVRVHIGPVTEVVELDGRAVLPGFIDSHVHLVGAGRLAVKARARD
jgi:predicted amidohydrolase YtcJ